MREQSGKQRLICLYVIALLRQPLGPPFRPTADKRRGKGGRPIWGDVAHWLADHIAEELGHSLASRLRTGGIAGLAMVAIADEKVGSDFSDIVDVSMENWPPTNAKVNGS